MRNLISLPAFAVIALSIFTSASYADTLVFDNSNFVGYVYGPPSSYTEMLDYGTSPGTSQDLQPPNGIHLLDGDDNTIAPGGLGPNVATLDIESFDPGGRVVGYGVRRVLDQRQQPDSQDQKCRRVYTQHDNERRE